MLYLTYLISTYLFIIYITFFFRKKKILSNQTGDTHQTLVVKDSIPLTGGIFILLGILYDLNFYQIIIFPIIFLFILGILSDLKIIKSPNLKVFFQIVIILSFIYFSNIQIYDTRIEILDHFLENYYFNLFFITFSILVVINGSNFIDGMNSLTTTYFIIVLGILFKLYFFQDFNFYIKDHYMIFGCMLLMAILNFKSKIFLGDSGSYILGFYFSILLIHFYKINPQLSPFLIILLLWYPCYENLFSILRKFNFKKSPLLADKNHLHQLIFLFFKKKYRLSNLYSNNLTTFFITFFNFLIFIFASMSPTKSEVQVAYIFLGVFLYTISYIKLLKLKAKKYI